MSTEGKTQVNIPKPKTGDSGGGRGKEKVVVKTKIIQIVLHPEKEPELDYKDPHTVQVIVVGGRQETFLTIHPVIPDTVRKKGWCITRPTDLVKYRANKEDPRAFRVIAKRKKAILDAFLLTEPGLSHFVKDNDVIKYKGSNDPQIDAMKTAEKAAVDLLYQPIMAKFNDRVANAKANKQTPPKVPKRPQASRTQVLSQLSDANRQAERAYHDYTSKDTVKQKAKEEIKSLDYENYGGGSVTMPQEILIGIETDSSVFEVRGALIRYIRAFGRDKPSDEAEPQEEGKGSS